MTLSWMPPNTRLHLTPPSLRFGGAGEAQAVGRVSSVQL